MEATPEDQHSHHGHRTIPMLQINEGPHASTSYECTIMYSAPYRAASDQTHIVPLLPTFHGMESENPYAHIKEFEDDKAKIWLNSLRPRSIRTWTDLQAEFLKKFFPTHRTNGLKRQISNFSAKENEKFYECWERYMEAINACPHHGFDTWLLVSYFYDGMSSSMKQLLETMCGGDFMREVGKMKSQPNAFNAKAGMYTLNEDVDMKAKFAAMTRRLEELELKKMHEVQAVAETPVQVKPCPICQSYEHLVEECPTIPAVGEMFGDQANVIGQFKPNQQCFVWKLTTQVGGIIQIFMEAKSTSVPTAAQPSQQASSLEQAIVNLSKVVGDFVGDQKSINAQLSQRIDMQEKGRFPSQPHQNPKGIHEVETHEGESSQVRDVKALITLRSGKKVEYQHPSHMLKRRRRRDKEEGGNQRKEERYQ
ncbi:hypothetical protein CK203_065166 [Vitis vinifera]|uniref:Retrotransposon gag domain-containing protein n=1 Tax=Vitis vinifera TaxID=29760 RepID=A0A438G724_VITVI|nr:hypothetical protein CK203_065166 [Vitis vinifera]